MKDKTCCFSGHRNLPTNKVDHILKRLEQEIENLINQGVTTFISGGAINFDQTAASMIIEKRQLGANIQLVFMLPCHNQDKLWKPEQKLHYRTLLNKADKILYISDEYTKDCMKLRNYAMVDNSNYCICAFLHGASGTSQTVAYAKKMGLTVINVAE